MKHTLKVTLMLISVFVLAQIIGLIIINQYIDTEKTKETGETVYKELPLNMERPQFEETKHSSWIISAYLILAILIGTGLVLLLVKFKGRQIWKVWFFIAATICLTISFGAFVNQYIAIVLAASLAALKTYKPNFYIHNATEPFMYGGLAAIFVPINILNITAAIILLVLISIYDMIAVWQSKHMVTLAKFQTNSKVFAGINIPYTLSLKETPQTIKKQVKSTKKTSRKAKKQVEKVSTTTQTAILGGGDIGFPLLFAGVVMKTFSMWKVMIIPVVTTITLFLLLYYAKKDKFYPAMPFLSAGCLVSYGIILLI